MTAVAEYRHALTKQPSWVCGACWATREGACWVPQRSTRAERRGSAALVAVDAPVLVPAPPGAGREERLSVDSDQGGRSGVSAPACPAGPVAHL